MKNMLLLVILKKGSIANFPDFPSEMVRTNGTSVNCVLVELKEMCMGTISSKILHL